MVDVIMNLGNAQKSSAKVDWESARAVVSRYRSVLPAICALTSMNVHLTLCGDIAGDFALHILMLLQGLAAVSLGCMGSFGCVALPTEVKGHLTLLFLSNIVGLTFSALHEESKGEDVILLLLTSPILGTFTHLFLIYVVVQLDLEVPTFRCAATFQALLLPKLIWVLWGHQELRWLWNGTAVVAVFQVVSLLVLEYAKKELLALRQNLSSKIELCEKTLSELHCAKRVVDDSNSAMSQMLTALCDVVVELDGQFCISNPSGQLHDFLMAGMGGSKDDLLSRNMLDFVASTDRARLSDALLGHRQGVAGALHVHMLISAGAPVSVELFYTHVSRTDNNPTTFMVGLRCSSDRPQAEAVPSTPISINSDSLEVAKFTNECLPTSCSIVEGSQHDDRHARDQTSFETASSCSGISAISSDSEASDNFQDTDQTIEEDPNPSRIAIHFDAATERLDLIGASPVTPEGTIQAESLMHLIRPSSQQRFEDWLLSSINAAPWDGPSCSQPCPFELPMVLPRVPKRRVTATKVWLETFPPEDDHLPTRLWIEGLVPSSSPERPHHHHHRHSHRHHHHSRPFQNRLEPVKEQDCVESDDSSVTEAGMSYASSETSSLLSRD